MVWYLQALADDRGSWRTEVAPLPFRVGRRENCQLRLSSPSISGEHAVIGTSEAGELYIDDLGSTNGTFVNLQQISGRVMLSVGDVLHFADQEFRLVGPDGGSVRSTATVNPDVIQAMRGSAVRRSRLENFIRDRQFQVLFQPIFSLRDGEILGYEALGRSILETDFSNADDMFSEANRLSLCRELSEALRFVSSLEARHLSRAHKIFLNTHPEELDDQPRLLRSIDEFLESVDQRQIVIEIHEMAASNTESFGALRAQLAARGIELAFDDFGRGQSRFLELSEFSPQFVKFDRVTIALPGAASGARSDMIRAMVEQVHRLGQLAVAEGIETQEELDLCRDLGFDFGQGFLLGRPRPADEPPTLTGWPSVTDGKDATPP